ncbi:hypothetical protein [uncultured Ruminococcus sp.]|uniref:hypothetical protein n=1 Tax=uncultured Ruminococcus sp. TaxID=165186 RepID=UPI002665A910|nr:hypothetical protein [uncultured Ruminococcus sp.]
MMQKKKVLAVLSAAVMLAAVTVGCGDSEEESSKSKKSKAKAEASDQADSKAEETDQADAATKDGDVIYSYEDLSIIFDGVSGSDVLVSVKNDGEDDYELTAKDISVNGTVLDTGDLYYTAEAGTERAERVTLAESGADFDLQEAEFTIQLKDTNTTITSEPIHLTFEVADSIANAEDSVGSADLDTDAEEDADQEAAGSVSAGGTTEIKAKVGCEVYSNGDITITYKGISGTDVNFEIENTSAMKYTVFAEDITVNGISWGDDHRLSEICRSGDTVEVPVTLENGNGTVVDLRDATFTIELRDENSEQTLSDPIHMVF